MFDKFQMSMKEICISNNRILQLNYVTLFIDCNSKWKSLVYKVLVKIFLTENDLVSMIISMKFSENDLVSIA